MSFLVKLQPIKNVYPVSMESEPNVWIARFKPAWPLSLINCGLVITT